MARLARVEKDGVSEAVSGDLVPGAFGNRAGFFKRLVFHIQVTELHVCMVE